MDLNHRPLPYQGSALTKLSYGPEIACRDYPTPLLRLFRGRGNTPPELLQSPLRHSDAQNPGITPLGGTEPNRRHTLKSSTDKRSDELAETANAGAPLAPLVPSHMVRKSSYNDRHSWIIMPIYRGQDRHVRRDIDDVRDEFVSQFPSRSRHQGRGGLTDV